MDERIEIKKVEKCILTRIPRTTGRIDKSETIARKRIEPPPSFSSKVCTRNRWSRRYLEIWDCALAFLRPASRCLSSKGSAAYRFLVRHIFVSFVGIGRMNRVSYASREKHHPPILLVLLLVDHQRSCSYYYSVHQLLEDVTFLRFQLC